MTHEELIEKYKKDGVKIYDAMPKGWIEIKGATTQPYGYKWICNGIPFFKARQLGLTYESALLKIR